MRILHTMLRVGNLEKSIAFYTEIFDMQLIRKKDYPDGKESDNAMIELTYNWDTEHYDLGNGYGHIALEVDDVYTAVDAIKQQGGKILREAGPMNAGSTIIAFVEDPDGYQIELIAPKK